MTKRIAQFNDGLGWRNKYMIDDALTDDQALAEIKQHHQRWPDDELRIIEEADGTVGVWVIAWAITRHHGSGPVG